jgi:TPR repeat protein
MYNLGQCYRTGCGVPSIDLPQAKQLFEKAAALGDQNALRALKELASH